MRRRTRVWVLLATGWGGHAAGGRAGGFAPRFTANDDGAISIFGHNLLTCPAADSRCAGARAGIARLNNNSFATVNLDADGAAGAVNSRAGQPEPSVVSTRRTLSFQRVVRADGRC